MINTVAILTITLLLTITNNVSVLNTTVKLNISHVAKTILL